MRKGVYQDSIRPCDLYTNPYDIRLQSHPALVKKRQEVFLKSRDTISSAQSRMVKTILRRLLSKNRSSASKDPVASAALVKYLLIALTLPAYLFLYAMPKWLFAKGLFSLDVCAKVVVDVFKRARLVAARFVAPVKRVFETLKNRVVGLYRRIADRAERVKNTFQAYLIQPLYRLAVSMRGALPHFEIRLTRLAVSVKKLQRTIQAFHLKLRSFLVELPEAVKDIAERVFHTAAAAFFRFSDRLKDAPFFSYTSRMLQSARLAAGRAASHLSRAAQSMTRPIRSFVSEVSRAIGDRGQNLGVHMKRWVDFIRDPLSRLRNRIFHEVSSVRQKSAEMVRSIVDKTVEAVKDSAKSAIGVLQALPALVMRPALSLFNLIPPVSFGSAKAGRLRKVMKIIMRKLGDRLGSGLHWSASKLALLKSFVKKRGVAFMREIVRRLPSFLAMLKRAFLAIFAALQGGVLLARLILAWTWALIRYAWLLAGEATRKVFT